MIMRKFERGGIFPGLLILFFVGILVVVSMNGAISRFVVQEKGVRQHLVENDEYEEALLVGLRDLEKVDRWHSVGVEDNCRLFSNSLEDDLNESMGRVFIYGYRLSRECLIGKDRQLFKIQLVDSEEGSLKGALSAYVVRSNSKDVLERIDSWMIDLKEDVLDVTIHYKDKTYQYDIEDRGAGMFGSEAMILRSVLSEGFLLLYRQEVWLLPMDPATEMRGVGQFNYDGGEFLSGFSNSSGLYLVKRNFVSGEMGIAIDFYPRMLGGLAFGKGEQLLREEVRFQKYEELLVDEDKLIVRLISDERDTMLAVMWSGATVWGGQYLWQAQVGINCPLQSEVFEPIAGWILGCQRKFNKM